MGSTEKTAQRAGTEIVLFTRCYDDGQVNDPEMGAEYSANGEYEKGITKYYK